MNRRTVFTLSAISTLGLALLPGSAVAQQAGDVDGVKAARKAFYSAVAVLDNGEEGKGVGSYTLRHVCGPAFQDDYRWLGCPEEVLGR